MVMTALAGQDANIGKETEVLTLTLGNIVLPAFWRRDIFPIYYHPLALYHNVPRYVVEHDYIGCLPSPSDTASRGFVLPLVPGSYQVYFDISSLLYESQLYTVVYIWSHCYGDDY